MTKFRLLAATLAAALCLAAAPNLTQACDRGVDGCGLLGVRAFGYSGTLYGLGYVPVPPYFALHPPVYYGERYYRSYGGSPFARSAARPQANRVVARVIVNPHVKQVPALEQEAAPDTPKTARAELIINPFYQPAKGQLAGHTAE